MSAEPWEAMPSVQILDIFGELCTQFMGSVRVSVNGATADRFMNGWRFDGIQLDIVNGTTDGLGPLATAVQHEYNVPVRRSIRFVGEELIGHDKLVQERLPHSRPLHTAALLYSRSSHSRPFNRHPFGNSQTASPSSAGRLPPPSTHLHGRRAFPQLSVRSPLHSTERLVGSV